MRYDLLKKLISSFTSSSRQNISVEDKDFQELSKDYLLIKDKLQKFHKDTIPFDDIEYQIISDTKQNPKNYSYCARIFQLKP